MIFHARIRFDFSRVCFLNNGNCAVFLCSFAALMIYHFNNYIKHQIQKAITQKMNIFLSIFMACVAKKFEIEPIQRTLSHLIPEEIILKRWKQNSKWCKKSLFNF